MKILSVAIPSYNSQDYMEHCVESLLVGGEDVEILIVDDGSKDRTAEIADSYEKKYPSICRAIHQENGGHGEAVNAGLRNATGLYYKVVDSDDWVDKDAYLKILNKLKEIVNSGNTLDMMISNFVYEKQGKKHKKVMSYHNMLPVGKMFTWDDLGRTPIGKYILMHSVIYRTQMLKDCGLELPKHTFYVDNIFVYYPLPYVKTMYYMDVEFYRYFIGRGDQSVQESVMIKRIDQQIKVNKLMIEQTKLWDLENKKLQKYMLNYVEIITAVSTILCIRSKNKENDEKSKALWEYIDKQDPKLYKYLRHRLIGTTLKHKHISNIAYKIAHKFVGFN